MAAAKRIAVGGFMHETNTFCSLRATFDEFERQDVWPGLTRGAPLLTAVADMNMGLAGYVRNATQHQLTPLLWCSAEPSGFVTEDAFERITDMLLSDLDRQGPFDGVFLDLHGAMVTEHCEDGEGELLRRVRDVVGEEVPVVASLDFHANVTEAMFKHADALAIYRTYPHLDMETTGVRGYLLLERLLTGAPLAKAFRKLPFMMPLTAQCTDFEPNIKLFEKVSQLETGTVRGVEFAEGFPTADIYECGPSVVVYADTQDAADAAAEELYADVLAAEAEFSSELWSPAEAVSAAMSSTERPVVLADVQDNAGAGGHSDTVGLLRAMVDGGATDAVLAILHDPDVTYRARELGEGARFDAELGAKLGSSGEKSFASSFVVERLSDGCFDCTGEMYRGVRAKLGSMVLLRVDAQGCDVRVVVGSTRFQCLDRGIFLHLGIDPKGQRLVGVKSTVHFRADFDAIAARTLAVEAPGVHYCRLSEIPFQNLRPGVRLL